MGIILIFNEYYMKYQNGLESLCEESYTFFIYYRAAYTCYIIPLVISDYDALHSMNFSLKL